MNSLNLHIDFTLSHLQENAHRRVSPKSDDSYYESVIFTRFSGQY